MFFVNVFRNVFRLLSLIILIIDNSSLRTGDRHISINFKILFTLYATSNVEEVSAFFRDNLEVLEVMLFCMVIFCLYVVKLYRSLCFLRI